MKRPRASFALVLVGAAAGLVAGAGLSGCDTPDPTHAVVENAYPEPPPDGGEGGAGIVVFRTWWVATLFADPVLPGTVSAEERTVPETGPAYALLAPGWDPESGAPPARLVPVISRAPLRAVRGTTLRIQVSDETFAGNCAAGQPLSEEDADFVTQRIFPGAFAGLVYDARTCTSAPAVPAAPDTDAGPDGATRPASAYVGRRTE